jgi:FkbM family methyltransferase
VVGQNEFVYKSLIAIERALTANSCGRHLKRIPFAVSCYRSLYRAFVPSEPVVRVVRGVRIFLDATDLDITRHFLLENGVWEPEETEKFLSLVKTGMVVVDVGANFGYYTLLAADAVGNAGKVYSFEPAPKNYALLRKNIEANNYLNVITVPKAVSNRCGKAKLQLSAKSSGGHTLSTNDSGRDFAEVETVTLDQYFAGWSDTIDLIKLDAEGAEELVLDGMTSIIKRSPNLVLLTEFYPQAIREMGSSPERFIRRLFGFGFDIFPFGSMGHTSQALELTEIPTLIESLTRQGAPRNVLNLLCVRSTK